MGTENKVSAIQAIVLAAGSSSRFQTGRTKMAEKICGREMILYPTQALVDLQIPILVVVGYQKDVVEGILKRDFEHNVNFIEQKEQLGTGHAIQCTKEAWKADHILIMNGDMPLVTTEIIQKLYTKHIQSDAAMSFVTAHHCDPNAMYGRVIKANENIQIIEAKEFDGDLSEHCCVNAGIYLVKKDFLKNHINTIEKSAVGQEWYITDLVKIASDNNLKVETVTVPFDRIRGVNDFKELWAAEQIKKSEIIQGWMNEGVRFTIAHNVQIDWDVKIGKGTSIGSGVQLLKGTRIGTDTSIGAFSSLINSVVEDRVFVGPHTVIEDSILKSDSKVGPFSYVHGNSEIADGATVGSFVEVNRSIVGEHSKAKHLSYLGDTQVGKNVIVGAGMIACNYNGNKKSKTIFRDNCFIGGNSTFVAPVEVGEWAITGAGSTITENVPDHALAIARERQINKSGYAKTIRERAQKETEEEEPQTFVAATKVNQDYETP